jgi:hypothetical protein
MVEGILKGMDKKNNIDGMRASIYQYLNGIFYLRF